MPGPSPRKTPKVVPGPSPNKTPLSRQEAFSWIFGDPIKRFPNYMPTKMQVIQRWMDVYDNIRGSSWKMSKEQKNLAFKNVVSELIANWDLQQPKPDLSSPTTGTGKDIALGVLKVIEETKSTHTNKAVGAGKLFISD